MPSAEIIKEQETQATGVLDNQAAMQKKMLDHQYEAQKKMLEADAKRTIDVTTQQYQQQLSQAVMALDQSYKQQEMALTWRSSSALWPLPSRRLRCLLMPSSTSFRWRCRRI